MQQSPCNGALFAIPVLQVQAYLSELDLQGGGGAFLRIDNGCAKGVEQLGRLTILYRPRL